MALRIALIALLLTSLSSVAFARPGEGQRFHHFWKISKDGRSGYILGTMHQGVPSNALPESVLELFATAPSFYMELDLSKTQEIINRQYAPLPAEESLQDKISASAWQVLVKMLALYGLDASDVARKSPNSAISMVYEIRGITVPVEVEDIRQEFRKASMDKELYHQARQRGTPLGFLDSEHVRRPGMERDAARELDKLLLSTDEQIHASLIEVFQLMTKERAAYLDGDADTFLDYIRGEMAEDSFNENITERNALWLPDIEHGLLQDGVFFAVGVGHLPGPGGLVEMLRKRGYTVERFFSMQGCAELLLAPAM
ncbi:MAG: TraB/GumN family protein [Bdellovibrionales bacterium]|nr:TraB/GumN family protein [Bdellovibrionales bacterium]